MPLHKLPIIMAFNVQENAVLEHEFSKITHTRVPPRVAFLPRFGPFR